MSEKELVDQLALHMLPGIGPVFARTLLSYCGSIDEIFRKKKSHLERIPGIGRERAALVDKKRIYDKAEREAIYIRKNNITPLFYLDEKYPKRLKNCFDAPLMLFSKGSADLNSNRIISIVGTRYMTPYGRSVTEKLVEDLRQFNVVIVSGLAFGIDTHAHKCSLKNGIPTIGVIAHGLDRIYPAENRFIAEKMLNDGGLLTEYTSGTIPDRENFPARNRIVAGMSDATIVIESAEKGGALITADLANDYNRDVFAIPGRTTDHYSCGCNLLIRKNKAMLLESAQQLAEMLNWDDNPKLKKAGNQLMMFSSLNEQEKILVDLLTLEGAAGIDTISIMTGMPVSKVSVALLNLEFAGVLRSLPGKMYELI